MIHRTIQSDTLSVVLDSQPIAAVVLHTNPCLVTDNTENLIFLDDLEHEFPNLSCSGRTRTMI